MQERELPLAPVRLAVVRLLIDANLSPKVARALRKSGLGPADRLRRLIANAVRLSQRRNVYAALGQAGSGPAQAVLQRVAEQRIAFLAGLYAGLGLSPQRARLLARLAYAT